MNDQPQSRQITPAQEIRQTLAKMEPQFQAALPSHISPQKFVRVATTAIMSNPNLLKAERTSLYAACTKAAQDGLLPDGREAALVMFGDKAQYMPMMAGILKKLRNSGELSSITALVVHSNDPFRYWVDSEGEHLTFEPNMFSERGEIIGVFAMAKLTDGALYVEVMTLEQIEKVRAVSRAAKNGPWVTWWDEMARKTVMRRLSKRLPMSTDIDFGIEDDERVVGADTGPQVPPTSEMRDVTPPPQDVQPAPEKKPRQTRARAAVEAKQTVQQQPEQTVEDGIRDADYETVDEDGVVYDGQPNGGLMGEDEIPI